MEKELEKKTRMVKVVKSYKHTTWIPRWNEVETAEDSTFLFLGLRFLGAIPTMKFALDKALEEGEYSSSIFLSPKSDG